MRDSTLRSDKFLFRLILAVLVIGLALALLGQITAAAAPDTLTENHVLICHVPPFGPMWIWVNESAVEAHLDHGDYKWSANVECGGELYPSPDPALLHFMHLPVVQSN